MSKSCSAQRPSWSKSPGRVKPRRHGCEWAVKAASHGGPALRLAHGSLPRWVEKKDMVVPERKKRPVNVRMKAKRKKKKRRGNFFWASDGSLHIRFCSQSLDRDQASQQAMNKHGHETKDRNGGLGVAAAAVYLVCTYRGQAKPSRHTKNRSRRGGGGLEVGMQVA